MKSSSRKNVEIEAAMLSAFGARNIQENNFIANMRIT
jgi:hypothetical protein